MIANKSPLASKIQENQKNKFQNEKIEEEEDDEYYDEEEEEEEDDEEEIHKISNIEELAIQSNFLKKENKKENNILNLKNKNIYQYDFFPKKINNKPDNNNNNYSREVNEGSVLDKKETEKNNNINNSNNNYKLNNMIQEKDIKRTL